MLCTVCCSANAVVFVKKPILGDGLVPFETARGEGAVLSPGGVPTDVIKLEEDGEDGLTDDPGSPSPFLQRGQALMTVKTWDGLPDFELNFLGTLVIAGSLVVLGVYLGKLLLSIPDGEEDKNNEEVVWFSNEDEQVQML